MISTRSCVSRWSIYGLAVVFVVACAVPATPSGPSAQSAAPSAAEPAAVATGPKHLTMGIHSNPLTILDNRVSPMSEFARAGLTTLDDQKQRQPMLAEAVPSIDNGLWRVLPDGRMETTWRIRDGVKWHDGQPFTSADLAFTVQLGQDPALTIFSTAEFALIESVLTPDPRTVTLRWKEPFINADQMFAFSRMNNKLPEPKHLLETPFLENKAGFESIPHWTTDYVGLGPYKLREWVPGTQISFEAFPEYVLGRPKIDRVEIKVILDPNTLLANVLSGAIDLTGISTVPIESGAPLREQWRDGDVVPYPNGWTMLYLQFDHPNPVALRDAQFRRALVYAIDRQQLADEFSAGTSAIAHSIIAPDQPEYRLVENSIVKYDYDPRRATQLIEGMGFNRGPDGIFRDTSGERMSMKIQTPVNTEKTSLAVADFWQRAGVAGEVAVVPAQGMPNNVRWAYTGAELLNQDHGVLGIPFLLHSSAAPLPERNYVAPNQPRNRGSYVNPAYDALLDRYMVTIPVAERMQVLGQILNQQTDQALIPGLYYTIFAVMIAKRLQNVPPAIGWNNHVWDTR